MTFDRPYMISYQSSIVTMSASCTIFEISLIYYIITLRGHVTPITPTRGYMVISKLLAYMLSKFDGCNFSHSRVMIEGPKFKLVT